MYELEQYLRVERDPEDPLVLILDGADEARQWRPGQLPIPPVCVPGVKVLVSARRRLEGDFAAWQRELRWDALADRVTVAPLGRGAIAELVAPEDSTQVSDATLQRLEQLTGGEPAIVSLYASGSTPTQLDMSASPVDTWLHYQEAQLAEASSGPIEDSKELQALVSVLAVARGPLAREDLARLAGISSGRELGKLSALGRWVVEIGDEQARGSGGYAFSHPVLAMFFTNEMLGAERRELAERLLAFCRDALQERRSGSAPTTASAYALAHLAAHLTDALEAASTAKAGPRAEELAAALTDAEFQKAYIEDLRDVAGLRSDLDAALSALVANDAATLCHVVRVALGIWEFRTVRLEPDEIFALADAGKVEDAERRLALFDADERWRQAARLAIGWVALHRGHPEGAELLARARRDLIEVAPLTLMLARIEAMAEGKPPPQLEPLPDPPDGPEAEVIVAWVDGSTDPSTLEYAEHIDQTRGVNHSNDEASILRATIEAPQLVAYAVSHPTPGRELLERYITAHLANPYQEYRDSSLWEILACVLRDPDDAQARDVTRRLAVGALAPAGKPFTGALPMTLEALAAVSAPAWLDERVKTALAAADALRDEPGKTDLWSHQSRGFAALAEVTSLALGRSDIGEEMLSRALCVPGGFAGYQAPAAVTLAEAFSVCGLDPSAASPPPLDAATRAAHNIREPGFCARTTARVNAMRRPMPLDDVEARVQRFADDPAAPEFAALHRVGEGYDERIAPTRAALPPWVLSAASLPELAHDVYRSSLASFQRLNPSCPPQGALDLDEEIRVPDPGFAPLMAARLAADALAAPGLHGDARARLIRTLVPIAAANRTALDTVLARLTLADPPAEPATLTQLRALAEATV
jgi:hypothetical protein